MNSPAEQPRPDGWGTIEDALDCLEWQLEGFTDAGLIMLQRKLRVSPEDLRPGDVYGNPLRYAQADPQAPWRGDRAGITLPLCLEAWEAHLIPHWVLQDAVEFELDRRGVEYRTAPPQPSTPDELDWEAA